MAVRFLKIILTAFVALLALFYAFDNIANSGQAQWFVATVLAMEGHGAYPVALGPAITSPALAKAALYAIIAGEVVTGLLAGKGAFDLWGARRARADAFNAAKTFALLGCGAALIVWFGLFGVIGGAWFQMWQTDLGAAALNGAFQFSTSAAVIMIFLNMPDH